jgi:hypothetical protein
MMKVSFLCYLQSVVDLLTVVLRSSVSMRLVSKRRRGSLDGQRMAPHQGWRLAVALADLEELRRLAGFRSLSFLKLLLRKH